MPRGTVLVTGAAGFAGGHLVDCLLTRAHGGRIVGWHRPAASGGRVPPPRAGVTWQPVDLLDRQSVFEAVAALQPGEVYHCAGAAHVGDAWHRTQATFAINVRGTSHLLDALAATRGSVRMLLAGSALVYRPASEALAEDHALVPSSPYGLSKLAQEMLARQAPQHVAVTVARAFNHFGPGQDPSFSTSGFARQVAAIEAGLQPPEIAVGNLEARRDLTDVRDTARAYRQILERGQAGRPYNVCSGRAVAIRDVLDGLVARARVPIAVRVDAARFRPNDLPILLGDPSRLHTELGWRAEIPIDRTLDDLLAYWRATFA